MKRSIPSLDGLRGLSILLVLAAHFYNATQGHMPNSPLWVILSNGALGVSIFFVLSGFLITSILLKEWDRSESISIYHFYQRRFFRIFPAFYFFLAVLAILSFGGWMEITRYDLWAAGLYVWDYSPFSHSWALDHTWSLSIEEQFYILWPTVLLLCLRRGGRRAAVKLCVVLIALSPLFRIITYLTGNHYLAGHLYFMLHTRLDALMCGCLVALLWGNEVIDKISTLPARVIAMASVFLFCVSPLLTHYLGGKYIYIVGFSLESLLIAVVMIWLVKNKASLAGRALNYPLLAHVGVISYSLYLWQEPFLHERSHSFLGSKLVNVVLLFLCAEFSYFFIEKTFLRIRERLEPHARSDHAPLALDSHPADNVVHP